ncbi:MAG: hypothetical protein LBB88_03365 [Planctomycetaceae bacterium]|jgi:hypothetical protein|nr:hypothetical protein [Planctomycetaceae bacterium]
MKKITTNKYNFFVVLFILAIVIFSDLASGQDKPATTKPEPQVQQIAGLKA